MLRHKAKHLAIKVRAGFFKVWGPGLVAIGIALMVWAFVENNMTVVHPVAAVSPSSSVPSVSAKPTASATATAEPAPSTAAQLYKVQPALGAHIGTITFPTLKLSWPIFEGTESKELNAGVGHFSQSVLPGVSDNSVLSGHRSTVFNRLGELKVGDPIYVRTSAGTFTYVVAEHRIVLRTDRSVIVPKPSATLTLTTCWPFNNVGVTIRAYVVTATLQP